MLRRILLAGWPLILTVMLLGAGIGYFIEFRGKSVYQATATLYVAPPTSSNSMDAVMGDQYAASRTQLYLELAQSDQLAQRVAAQIRSSDAPNVLASKIKVTGSHDAPLLTLTASGSTPAEALILAKAYLVQFPEFAKTVEQGSGIREGPVLVDATGAQSIGEAGRGLKGWLRATTPGVILVGLALIWVIWYRKRYPNAADVAALRRALPDSFVERVGKGPQDLQRLHAFLFAAPNSARTLVFAGARRTDELDGFVTAFTNSLARAELAVDHVNWDELDVFSKRNHTRDIVVIDGPALLDETQRIPVLATHVDTAVIVAMGRRTLVMDVAELAKLLRLNDVEIKGVLTVMARPGTFRGAATKRTRGPGPQGEDPWPKIQVLEDAAARPTVGRPDD
jgi:hypothetical protein